MKPIEIKLLAGVMIAASVLMASAATATVFTIDEFSVELNGNSLFQDSFSDNSAPPSAPSYLPSFPTTSPAASYAVGGTIIETGGKAILDAINNGEANQNVANLDGRVVRARLLTPTNPADTRQLGIGDTFNVSGVYDLVMPGNRTEDYRIRLTDRSTQNNSPDSLDLKIERRLLDNQVFVRFVRANYALDTNQVIAQVPIDLTGNPDQIRLNLAKTDGLSNAITASFSYIKNGQVLGTQTFGPTAVIFNVENYTRAQFNAQILESQVPTPSLAARLQTGSPTSISQAISTGNTPFNLTFDYQFETSTGVLDVTINGITIGSIAAPGSLSGVMQNASFLVSGGFLSLTNAILKFTLNGPTGSKVLLDNILGVALANGNFQVGNLSGWTLEHSGAGLIAIADVTPTPLPAALPLYGTVLGILAFLGWRRKRKHACSLS